MLEACNRKLEHIKKHRKACIIRIRLLNSTNFYKKIWNWRRRSIQKPDQKFSRLHFLSIFSNYSGFQYSHERENKKEIYGKSNFLF